MKLIISQASDVTFSTKAKGISALQAERSKLDEKKNDLITKRRELVKKYKADKEALEHAYTAATRKLDVEQVDIERTTIATDNAIKAILNPLK